MSVCLWLCLKIETFIVFSFFFINDWIFAKNEFFFYSSEKKKINYLTHNMFFCFLVVIRSFFFRFVFWVESSFTQKCVYWLMKKTIRYSKNRNQALCCFTNDRILRGTSIVWSSISTISNRSMYFGRFFSGWKINELRKFLLIFF